MKLQLPYKTGTARVSSPYGTRTLDGVTAMHKGIDLVGTVKTIVAPCDGVVGYAGQVDDKATGGRTWEWGKYVRIEAEGGYKVYLCHMSSLSCRAGQTVKAGDVIGVEGSTGYSFGSHCHFEVRYAGKSLDPTPMLGIANRVGSYPVQTAVHTLDDYTVDGLRIVKLKNPRLMYFDGAKNRLPGANVCNAGFFGNYKRGKTTYTLPRGNLVCDMGSYKPNSDVEQDVAPYVQAGKLRYNCGDNATDSAFRGKATATLVIPSAGSPYVADIDRVPTTAKYAVSGVPCIRSGDDVDWYAYVAKQGWGADTVRNAYHNWLGVRDGAVWLVTGKSAAKSGNMIYGMWFWKLMQDEGFDDCIKLDGGGSYYCKIDGKVQAGSYGSRRINSYLVWDR